MSKSKHKIISKSVAEAAAKKRKEVVVPPTPTTPYIPKPKTRIDEIYALIEEASNMCFTDEDGRPWIDREDIEDKGNGIYVVGFRCPLSALYTRVAFNRVVDKVCEVLNSERRYFCKECEVVYFNSIHQRFYECVWVICEGELSQQENEVDWEDNNCESCIDTQEEIEGELTDESTAEEVELRIDESLENFV